MRLWKECCRKRKAIAELNALAERYQEHIDDAWLLMDEAENIRARMLELRKEAHQAILHLVARSLIQPLAETVQALEKLQCLQGELEIQWKIPKRA